MNMRIVFLTVLTCVCAFSRCASVDLKQRPTVTLAGFSVESLSPDDVTFLVEVAIENPYPAGVTFSELAVKVLVENNELADVRTKQGLTLAARGRAVSPFRAGLAFADLERVVKDYASRDYLDCDIIVTLGLPSCLAGAKIDYALKKRIPVIRPVVSVRSVRITGADAGGKKGLSLKSLRDAVEGKPALEFEIEVEVENRAKGRIGCSEIEYELSVESERVAGGTTGGFRSEGAKSVLTLESAVTLGKSGDKLVGILKKKKAGYAVRGFVLLVLPEELAKNPVRMSFEHKGAVEFK